MLLRYLCLTLALLTAIGASAAPLSSARKQNLENIAYDTGQPLAQRIKAVRELVGVGDGYLQRTVCIWDLVGRNGPIFAAARDQQAKMLAYGIKAKLVPYTDESIMVEALKAGQCDAALMSGMRARLFNTYTGTIDAIGALPTNEHMRILLQVLADPRSAPKMVQGQYVIAGIAPAGAAYLFVDDKNINTLAKAAGKKVAVLAYDPVQAEMVAQIGATPVPTDFVSAPNMFNNGVVDVLAAPLAVYQIMELYKGMTPNGGIIDYPLAQISLQLVARRDRLPNAAAQLVREAFYHSYDRFRARIHQETKDVPAHWWVQIPGKDKLRYEEMMRQARITLRKKGYYSAAMLELERRIRCKLDPSRAECTSAAE